MKQKWISWMMMFAFLGMTAVPVQAAMVSTEQVIEAHQAQYDREQLAGLLDRADVQQKLVSMGVSADDVQQRIAAMTDAEVAELNAKITELPAGANALGIIVLIGVVLVITDLVGLTDVFPGLSPVY
ncbi:MAG: PA2779 family protein [Thiomicrospira sp.]|jgi:hypothetical protein|nr:PA2779 family protein [Thiomicrospira sp.]